MVNTVVLLLLFIIIVTVVIIIIIINSNSPEKHVTWYTVKEKKKTKTKKNYCLYYSCRVRWNFCSSIICRIPISPDLSISLQRIQALSLDSTWSRKLHLHFKTQLLNIFFFLLVLRTLASLPTSWNAYHVRLDPEIN